MRQIEIDDEVWRYLQQAAQPFVDSPNTVLRKTLGLAVNGSDNNKQYMVATRKKANIRQPKVHRLRSARHCTPNREIWWYGIPPIGKKYQQGDCIIFHLDDFSSKNDGEFSMKLTGKQLELVEEAAKDQKGYTHVKIWRDPGSVDTFIYFGRLDDGHSADKIQVRKV
jgi:hypothetical protein